LEFYTEQARREKNGGYENGSNAGNTVATAAAVANKEEKKSNPKQSRSTPAHIREPPSRPHNKKLNQIHEEPQPIPKSVAADKDVQVLMEKLKTQQQQVKVNKKCYFG
jgi:hypothetical protein